MPQQNRFWASCLDVQGGHPLTAPATAAQTAITNTEEKESHYLYSISKMNLKTHAMNGMTIISSTSIATMMQNIQ